MLTDDRYIHRHSCCYAVEHLWVRYISPCDIQAEVNGSLQSMLAHPTSIGCCRCLSSCSDYHHLCCQMVIHTLRICQKRAKLLDRFICILTVRPKQPIGRWVLQHAWVPFSQTHIWCVRLLSGPFHQLTVISTLDVVLLDDLGTTLAYRSASNTYPNCCNR